MIELRITRTRVNDWRPTRYRLARTALWSIVGLYAALTLLLVAGCAPLAAPRNTSDSLAYAEGQVQALTRACTTLNDERRISLEQAVRCKAASDQAFTAIDVGRGALRAGDVSRAEGQLALARTILVELERITGGQK